MNNHSNINKSDVISAVRSNIKRMGGGKITQFQYESIHHKNK